MTALKPHHTRSRERLFGPLPLAGIALAFVLAFLALALMPRPYDAADSGVSPVSTETDTPSGIPVHPSTHAAAPDPVALAYLRAQAGTHRVDDGTLLDALLLLTREGRHDEAEALLAQRPELTESRAAHSLMMLELHASALRDVIASDRDVALGEFRAMLAELLADQDLHEERLLQRGAVLAAEHRQTDLVDRLYRTLAVADAPHESRWLSTCADALLAIGDQPAALACLRDAASVSRDASERFSLGVRQLALLPDGLPAEQLLLQLASDPAASQDGLQSLATTALGRERPDIAANVYGRLAEVSPERRHEYLLAAARWAEAAAKPAEAAVWLANIDTVSDAAEQDRIRSERLRLLRAADRQEDILALAAEFVDAAPEDKAVVDDSVAIATAVGELELALDWTTRYLSAHPDDTEVLDIAVDLSLGLGNLALARRWSDQALDAQPDNSAAVTRAARIAEWAGEPDVALSLHQRGVGLGSTEAPREAFRLASALNRPDDATHAAQQLARVREPDAAELQRWIAAYEAAGQPMQAVDLIEYVNRRYGDSAYRVREIALLHQRHEHPEHELSAWQHLANRFGRTLEETLARTELLWRLGRAEEAIRLLEPLADLAADHRAVQPSAYQISLVNELAWRYRLDEVLAVTQAWSHDNLADGVRDRLVQRRIQALSAEARHAQAAREAEAHARMTDNSEFWLVALRQAVKARALAHPDTPAAEQARVQVQTLLTALAERADLDAVAQSELLNLRAELALENGDVTQATRLYRESMDVNATGIDALSGLMWIAIAAYEHTHLQTLLDEHAEFLQATPRLWPVFAMAHYHVGDAAASLPWFERAIRSVQSDYGLILSWADALEQAREVDRAQQVRLWALTELRPRLIAGINGHEGELLRQYAGAASRFASADVNEAWMQVMLSSDLDHAHREQVWREDMAIAWLMATERHDFARLIMAEQQGRRLQQPLWRELALALEHNDEAIIASALSQEGGLTAAARMLALRRVGRDDEAFALAVRTLNAPASVQDLAAARTHYVALRRFRPSHLSASHRSDRADGLLLDQTTLSLRHAPGTDGVGFAFDVARLQFDASEDAPGMPTSRDRAILGVFERHSRMQWALFAGIDADSADTRWFGRGSLVLHDPRVRREARVDVAWQEPAEGAAELNVAGKRDRFSVGVEQGLSSSYFVSLGLDATRVSGRISDALLARGLRLRADVGRRQQAGSLSWSHSLALETERHQRSGTLPREFAVFQDSTLDNILVDERTTFSINGSLARGSVNSDYPDVASPRLHLLGGLGYSWPEQRIGLNVDASAGIRVWGQDELALRYRLSATLDGEALEDDGRSFGLDYRYHF